MRLPFRLIDAFEHGPFTGNPAGVVLLEEPLADSTYQAIAMEVNQAETAFVWPQDGMYGLPWFTPTAEVDLCGHATLAAAHALGHAEVSFNTRSGVLTATRVHDLWELDFPAEPYEEDTALALPIAAVWQGRNRMDVVALVSTEAEVVDYVPDWAAITSLPARGMVITAPASRPDADYVCRFFGPQVGVPEDAVTGSAHCALAPFWAARLGKSELVGYQASARGGFVATTVDGSRVRLRGSARVTIEGELCL